MLTAFVFITCEASKINEVALVVASLPHVSEVHSVTGDMDLIATLRAPQIEALEQAVPGGIAKVPGVTGTKTVLAFRRFSKEDLEAGFDIGLN
ncbi:transcriptional regulator, AsnC family [Hyaloraphidium curvatum]|nr:transcriptional regulator, AsnC family [Hyaloraphidium curvatum]